jgi:hypothetical protein
MHIAPVRRSIAARFVLPLAAILACLPAVTAAQSSESFSSLPSAPMATEAVLLATSPRTTVLDFSSYLTLRAAQNGTSTSSPQNTQQTPASTSSEPSLSDLGLSQDQLRGNEKQQALLDRRTHMLKVHQRLGLITLIPVAAACISSIGAPPEHGSYGNTTSRDVHVAIGGVAVAMYGATAYYAIRAPKVSNEPARGGIKLHKYLIYLHAPGMVLTPILGAIAFNQINSGQKVHGIASAHGAVAAITAGSYGAAILAVSWPIHLKL